MLTDAEKVAVEYSRAGPPGFGRAVAAVLVDRDGPGARRELAAEHERLRKRFERLMPPAPGRASVSPCGIATLAAHAVLAHPAGERNLEPLNIAFDPSVLGERYNGCGPRAIDPALATIAWLAGDEAKAARHLIKSRPVEVLDRLLYRVLSLLVRGRKDEVAGALTELAPEYVAAMAQGLWKSDPDAFLHVRLLAVLHLASERGLLDLRALPDVIPYVPIWLLLDS